MRCAQLGVLIGVGAVLLGCGSDPVTSEIDRVATLVAGSGQMAIAGTAVPITPAVRVFDRGSPAAGVTVTFTVTAGGGQLQGGTAVTDANGIAYVGLWVLGGIGNQELTVTVPGAAGEPLRFTAQALAADPAILEVLQGGGAQSALVLDAVPDRPVIRVRDRTGRPLAGIPVDWSVAAGDAAGIRGADPVTGIDGTAGLSKWIMVQPGANVLTVRAAGLSATFTATGTPR